MFKKKTHETTTQELIDAANTRLYGIDVDSAEYNDALDKLERLHKLKSREKDDKLRISPDTLIMAGASILGVLIIAFREEVVPITSKALGFVIKPH